MPRPAGCGVGQLVGQPGLMLLLGRLSESSLAGAARILRRSYRHCVRLTNYHNPYDVCAVAVET